MNKILLCNGSIESFLSAVFQAYTCGEKIEMIITSEIFQTYLDSEIVAVEENLEHFERVKKSIIKNGGIKTFDDVKYALANCDPYKGIVILKFLRLLFKFGKDTLDMLHDSVVIAFNKLVTLVRFETHRMKGLLRFQETTSGIFYAGYNPDHDITRFLMPHFASRCNSMNFVIQDTKRNIVGIYGKGKWETRKLDKSIFVELSKEELDFEHLFQTYFNTVNIAERKNKKQQDGYLPKRYRKDLPEFNQNLNDKKD